MAVLTILNNAGSGFDMRGLNNGFGSFSTNDAAPTYFDDTYTYDFDTVYDRYFYQNSSLGGFEVYYQNRAFGVVIEDLYYFNSNSNTYSSLEGINVFVSYEDLNSGSTEWVIDFLNGNDRINGNAYRDFLKGGLGNDTLLGNGNGDQLSGEIGNDRLYGGTGGDRLSGGAGRDVLIGGSGRDLLYGGSGSSRDVFVFDDGHTAKGSSRDVIYDFQSRTDDIDLLLIDATRRSGDQDFSFRGQQSSSFSASGSVWFVDSGSSVIVRGDVNGIRGFDFEIEVKNVARLVSSDFIL